VAEDHRRAAARSARHVEPGEHAGRCVLRFALETQIHPAVEAAHAHARHRIYDHAQPRKTGELRIPAIRLIAVHIREKLLIVDRAQRVLDLLRKRQRLIHGPVRQQPSVHQGVLILSMHHRSVSQPIDQFIAIGRLQHVIQRIVRTQLGATGGNAEQMQIVIAQNAYGALAQRSNETQRL